VTTPSKKRKKTKKKKGEKKKSLSTYFMLEATRCLRKEGEKRVLVMTSIGGGQGRGRERKDLA